MKESWCYVHYIRGWGYIISRPSRGIEVVSGILGGHVTLRIVVSVRRMSRHLLSNLFCLIKICLPN